MRSQLAVVKVGGSLLVQPRFVERLQSWVRNFAERQAPVHVVLIVGGGPLVDGLRAIDCANAIAVEQAHWTAIRLMETNAELLAAWWPEVVRICSLAELQRATKSAGVSLFCVEAFLRRDEPNLPGRPLPSSWEATSDSIAARLAEILAAEWLVLLKAAPIALPGDWQEAAERGEVDLFFPQIACRLANVRLSYL